VLAGLSPKGSVNKPAGIRSIVYGMGKGKGGIEGLSVSAPAMATEFTTVRMRGAADHRDLLIVTRLDSF
jgi:hypothetical protein